MAVDAGSAVGYLDLDISGFLTGLRSAQSEADTASKNIATKIGGGLKTVGDKMAKVGKFATASITTPIVTAVTASVKQFANLEQSIGGVETLFKSSAQTVISNAETAYKRAGVDANNYMEQVTSFSATLLQGLGGDTQKAADYADKAIVDMSDNANKMGTNISLIQNAYQGFAKGNYTMLDNLKLGYGGTAGEMARLVNESGVLNGKFKATAENVKDIPFDILIEAIHVTQENLGITGTTAKEAAETISGSFQMAKSSVLNFLQQLGNPGADMDKFADEMIKSIGVFVQNVKRALLTIWDNLPISPLQKKLLAAAAAFGPVMFAVGKVTSSIDNMITTFGKIPGAISKVKSAFTKVSIAMSGISAPVVVMVAVLIAALVSLWKNNEEFRNKIMAIWNGITSFFSNVISSIKMAVSNFITTIINFFAQLPTNIANFITNAYNSVVTWASNMVAKAREMGQNFLNAVVSFFTNLPYKVGYFIGNTLANIVIWAGNMVTKAREMGTNFLNTVVSFFTQLPGKILQFITSAFNNVQTWATNMVNKAREMGTNFLNAVVSFFTQLPGKVLQFITNAYNSVVTWATNMVAKAREMGQNFLNAVVSFFTQLPGKVLQFITSAFNNVQTWATNMANKAREMGTNFINNVVSFMQQLPGKIKQYLDSAIDNLKTWVTQMGQKGKEAVQSLINNVMSAASGIASKVMSIGSDIVSGVWNGIKAAKDKFVSNVKSFFSGIVDGVKDALGIGSPSKVFRDEVGRWLPPGVVKGFEAAMPSAMKAIQKDLNKGIDGIDTDDISVGAGITVSGFADKLKSIYNEVALWFESIESRIGNSVDSMMQSLDMLVRAGHVIVNSDGTLGYIGYNGFTKTGSSEGYVDRTNPKDNNNSGKGDTFIFNSPKAIDEIEAAKQMKKTKQDMAEGF